MSIYTERYRKAGEASDVEGVLATMTPDVRMNAPQILGVTFDGKDRLRELYRAVFNAYENIVYHRDYGTDDSWIFEFSAHIGDQQVREVLVMDLDGEGRIKEITPYIRPLSALVTVSSAVGQHLAANRTKATTLISLNAPLIQLTRIGDVIGKRLLA